MSRSSIADGATLGASRAAVGARRLRRGVWLALLASGSVAACTAAGHRTGYRDSRLSEPSGLTAGRQPGVYWTHNDSGDGPILYAVTIDGRLLARFRVVGAEASDWEAITADGDGRLYVGDIGNNANDRQDLTVYRVVEPTVSLSAGSVVEGEATVERAVRFHFPEQRAFPPEARNFDAEALFFDARADGGRLYLLTKHRGDMATVLYRFEAFESGPSQPLSVRGRFVVGGDPDRFGGMVTGADLSPDGRHLAVLTYHALFVFARPPSGDDWLAHLVNRVDFDQDVTQQTEAVAWHGDAVVITNEQGAIFRVERPLDPRPGRFP